MPTNKTQTLIRHKRKRSGILVPLMEDLFQSPVEIDDEVDIDFITNTLTTMMERQKARHGRPVFSPSQLSECLRYVYLLKHHKSLDIVRARAVRVEPNFYFFNGNFLHLKWQFALHKLDRHINDPEIFKLHGVEVPILSKHKDHGGTADGLVSIYKQPYLVDFKGLNVRAFAQIVNGTIPSQYVMQLADYGMLFNSQRQNGFQIFSGLLVSENKGGPDRKHLIALNETEIPIKAHVPEVRFRLEVLREHEAKEEIPSPECESTTTYQFQGCPFRKYCKKEVQEIAKRKRDAEGSDSTKLEIARPSGSRDYRTARNSKRRRKRSA